MAKTKMDVNEKDIDKMEDTVLDAMDEPVKEVVKGNLKKMREEALAYLNKLKELKKDIEDIEDRIKKLKEFRHQYSNKVKVPGRKKAACLLPPPTCHRNSSLRTGTNVYQRQQRH